MIALAIVGLALADEPAGIDAADTPAPAAPVATEEAPGYALSVGTGPRPLNTLSLGLTGMGARFLVPGSGIYPWFGVAYHSFTLTEGDDDDDRWVSSASTWTVSAGVRGPLGGGTRYEGVDPYATVGVFANRVGLRSGDPDEDWDRTNGMTFGTTAAFGLEGHLNRHLSVGLEIGATAGHFTGGNEDSGTSRALVVTSLSAAQLTVWK